jgi:hypothetical protein
MAAEGFSRIMSKASQTREFKGIKIGNSEEVVTHLQFADDTLIFGEATLENVRALKSLLLLFQLDSGLNVNFYKKKKVKL